MTTHPVPAARPHLADARAKAAETYDRRRARDFAEALATIPPARWDNATKAIVITLATLAVPSRIDDVLDELIPLEFEPPIGAAGCTGAAGCPVHDNGDYRA